MAKNLTRTQAQAEHYYEYGLANAKEMFRVLGAMDNVLDAVVNHTECPDSIKKIVDDFYSCEVSF